ncbi:NAD(P)H-dependent oxidoreductase [Testudinibacter sp. TR-2022]|uniref:NAD(P)H-dependent oxidoreductase n=1 Tax=Testudinibacter sp. TR-2022 TaxID=2585029 RepID=UPI002277B224|nr:NAD(P)H-dependent oxidoreductase [Testudinibacter sp. TR-2022]
MTYSRREVIKTAMGVVGVAALGAVSACHAQNNGNAQTASTGDTMPNNNRNIRTLVLVSHPYFERSTLTKGLYEAAQSVAGITVRHLDLIYGNDVGAIDVAAETRLMNEHDRIVFVFPTHWFNITPMMKAWLNDVWGSVGPDRWKGKEMLVVSTAAGGSSTYGANGRIGVPLADVFLPMKATALHCGMTYLPPLVFENAGSSKLAEYQQALIKRLTA